MGELRSEKGLRSLPHLQAGSMPFPGIKDAGGGCETMGTGMKEFRTTEQQET